MKQKTSYNFLEKWLIKNSRKINYLLDKNGRYKCRAERIPQVIRIGPTNYCTGNCFYCPREYIHAGKSGYMDFSLFEQIIAWARDKGVKVISFALFGEPLLHPRFLDMIELAHRSGLKMRLSTNAIILKRELADKILTYPFEAIETSMDGFTPQEYLAGKQVDKFDQAKANILYLLKRAREVKHQAVFNVHFVDVGNVSFLNKIRYIRFWQKQLKGLKHETSFYYQPHNWAGTRDNLRAAMKFLDRLLARWELKKPCVYVKGININWNGDVLICANDPTPQAILGNIINKPLEEIYNSQRRFDYLARHEVGNFAGTNCAVCTVNSIWPMLFLKKKIMNKVIRWFS